MSGAAIGEFKKCQLAYQLMERITFSPAGSSWALDGDFQGFTGPTLDT